uniref:Metalloendopeptidase n=1 Tax=Parastrongyloides trichosuri TaxID=131310 RepID=A0A0N4ZZX6_PARTI
MLNVLTGASYKNKKPHFNWKAVHYGSISRFSWRFPIRYCVDFPPYEDNVTKAIDEFESKTCISFKKVSSCQDLVDGIRFRIKVASQFGCSYDGATKDNKIHKVYITDNCLENPVLMIKLLFQVLGITFHEYHNNRDSYVTLHNETAVIFKYPYFPDESIDYRVLNVSYDFGSMMHSPSKIGFNKNYTFITANMRKLSPYYEKMMGQSYKVTFTDWKIINKFYCNNFCKVNSVTCKNDGYSHPRNCKKCICPDGYTWKDCRKIKGKLITHEATNVSQFLLHHGKNNVTFRIKAPSNKILSLRVIVMESKDQLPCYYGSGIEIKYAKYKGLTGLCLCGVNKDVKVITDKNEGLIRYVGRNAKYKGLTGLCLCGVNKDVKVITDKNEGLIRYVGRSIDDFFVLEYKIFG